MPWAAWLAVLASAVIAAGLTNLGDLRWWRIAVSVGVFVAVLAGAWWFSRLQVRVLETGAAGEVWLHVDDAKLPMSAVSEIQVLDRVAYSDAMGVALHPLAFVVQRPWVGRGVRVVLDDPDDPTPYWLVSSRAPERLREALLSGDRAAA